MTHTLLKTISLTLAMLSVVVVPMLFSTDAEARGFKSHQGQNLYIDAPLRRSWGRFGEYYCDYVRVPSRVCVLSGRGHWICKVKGWTVRHTCY